MGNPRKRQEGSHNFHILTRLIKRTRIGSGDVVLIKANTELSKVDSLKELSDVMTQAGLHDIVIVVVDDLNDLSTINETEMNRRGWYRVRTLKKLIHRAPEEPEKIEEEEPEKETVHDQG